MSANLQTFTARPAVRPLAASRPADIERGRPLAQSTLRPGRILQRDEHLFRMGEIAAGTWIVLSGALKTYIIHEDGEEQVMGFHLAGDIVGFDAVVTEAASCAAVALDTSSVRRMSVSGLTGDDPDAATGAIVGGMRREIRRLTRLLHMERASTRQRLAAFLLDHADSQARRGLSRHEFLLPMCRRDLARYLGLATETLCRTFSRLRRQGIIRVDRNIVTIVDAAALCAEAGAMASTTGREAGTG